MRIWIMLSISSLSHYFESKRDRINLLLWERNSRYNLQPKDIPVLTSRILSLFWVLEAALNLSIFDLLRNWFLDETDLQQRWNVTEHFTQGLFQDYYFLTLGWYKPSMGVLARILNLLWPRILASWANRDRLCVLSEAILAKLLSKNVSSAGVEYIPMCLN